MGHTDVSSLVGEGTGSLKYKVIIGLNTAWNLYNFRSGLISALVGENYEVVTFAPTDDYVEKVEKLGCRFIPVIMEQRGVNFLSDLLLMFKFSAYSEKKNPIYFYYTVKPNVYGSIVSRLCGVKYINNVAGLGFSFWKQKLVARSCKKSLLISFY